MPFADYLDFDDCTSKNRDKGNPDAYCGSIKHKVEEEKTFSFNETEPITKGRSPEPVQGKKKAFTHSSSWIGNVRYNPQNQTMRVMMNNDGYGFCGVPEKVYDAWEGAPSKGEYWWRNIKDRYNCSALTETEMHDIQWPPPLTGGRDQVDCLMMNYSPDTGRPDGITPDELTLQTQPYPTGKPYTYPQIKEQNSACGNCRFYVDGGACALVKGVIDPVNGTCKFFQGGQSLPYNTQVFPIYEQVEAEYQVKPNEPYLSEPVMESVTKNIIDREHELLANGVPENEVHDILQKEFSDTSLSDMINETTELKLDNPPDDTNYLATASKINSEPSMHNEHGHSITNPKVMGYQNENPDPDALIFDIPPLYGRKKETKLIRETIGELTHQFNWMTDDYLARVTELGRSVGGKFVLVRASAEAITDHRSEGEPYRRLLKGEELSQLTRTGKDKSTDINHLGKEFEVDSVVLDAEYDPIRKESQMLVHLRDPEIIHYIETGDIQTVSINAGMPRHMHTECDTGECFVVPRGLYLGELDNIAFTWVVNNPAGIMWRGRHIRPAVPGVKTTRIELL